MSGINITWVRDLCVKCHTRLDLRRTTPARLLPRGCRCKERMFEGVVASKADAVEGLMYFSLKMANRIVEVQIGPKEFIERSGFKLSTGDRVTVIGMPAVVNGRHGVLARDEPPRADTHPRCVRPIRGPRLSCRAARSRHLSNRRF